MRLPYFTPLLILLALAAGPASAERADRQKPMNIESDALRHDDLRQTSQFTGRVVLTKGTLTIRAARLDVRQDAEGYQQGTATAAPGARAYYRQKREGVDEYIEGEAEQIDYDGRTDSVKFSRRAVLRRYKGATLSDESSGNVIVYNNQTEVFTVDSVPGAPGGSERVRAVLAPRELPSAAIATPAASVPLRPSEAIGKDRR